MHNTFKIFGGYDLRDHLINNEKDVRIYIENLSENQILNVNETNCIEYVYNEFRIDFPTIDFDNIFRNHYNAKIPANKFPNGFNIRSGKSYTRTIIVYHIPFVGNEKVFRYRPNKYLLSIPKVYLEENCICFEIINFENDANEINNQANYIITNIKTLSKNSQEQIGRHNNGLKGNIRQIFKHRKEEILKKNQMLASLDFTIKRKKEIPETFSIPTPKIRKKIIVKPKVTEEDFEPEPTLNNSAYNEILEVIYAVGKEFERLPSTYNDKNEEALRDHFLLFLEPNFEGSATGETFNKKGKTDILLRHENSNVFIAECKFWKGKKSYLDTITQLLKYLTWRDSKVAVIIFVENKEISSVLKTVKEATPEHNNYLGYEDDKTESWFNYRFHINDDRNREVKLAVLLFHIPKT